MNHTPTKLRIKTIKLSKHTPIHLEFVGSTKYVQLVGHGVRVVDLEKMHEGRMPECMVIDVDTDRRIRVGLMHLQFSSYNYLGSELTVSWLEEEGV